MQITASHNPPSDNGYKVYFDGGLQIVPPTDREIEASIGKAPHADEIPQGGGRPIRRRPDPALRRTARRMSGARTDRCGSRCHRHARCRRRVRARRVRAGRADRRARRREPVRARPRLPHGSVPQPGGARRHRRAAGTGGRRRRRGRHRAGSRRRPVRGRRADARRDGACSPATKPVGCWAITCCRSSIRAR